MQGEPYRYGHTSLQSSIKVQADILRQAGSKLRLDQLSVGARLMAPLTPYDCLAKRNMTKLNLGPGHWLNIFPDPLKPGYTSINTAEMNTFKLSDVLFQRRIKNKHYLMYLMGQVGITKPIKDFEKDIYKICKWCGNDDILCVQSHIPVQGLVTTATLLRGERVGYINHYLVEKTQQLVKRLKSRWLYFKIRMQTNALDAKKKVEREEALNKLIAYANALQRNTADTTNEVHRPPGE
jgi:hypothetical protein